MSEPSAPETFDSELRVPMEDVVRFVRQLCHDLRNQLNAAELQSAYVREIAEDAELKAEVQRLRGMLSEMGASLQQLTGLLSAVRTNPIPYKAGEFVEDFKTKLNHDFPAESPSVEWDVNVQSETLEIDPQLLQQALTELFVNAFRHDRSEGPLKVTAHTDGDRLILGLREPKINFEQPTENWGQQPFQKVKHGHYGLGLRRARAIVEAHQGRFEARFDPASSSLNTTVTLPLSGARL